MNGREDRTTPNTSGEQSGSRSVSDTNSPTDSSGAIPYSGIKKNFRDRIARNPVRNNGATTGTRGPLDDNSPESQPNGGRFSGDTEGDASRYRKTEDPARLNETRGGKGKAISRTGANISGGSSSDNRDDNRRTPGAIIQRLKFRGWGFSRIADELGLKISEIQQIASGEKDGDPWLERLEDIYDDTEPIERFPSAKVKDTPKGFQAVGSIPIEGKKETVSRKVPNEAIKVLSAIEAATVRGVLVELFHDAFTSMDRMLKNIFPLVGPDQQKIDPGIWAAIKPDECERLADIIIKIGSHNIYIAQMIRYAEKTNDARFVLNLFGSNALATGTYIQASRTQQRSLQNGSKN